MQILFDTVRLSPGIDRDKAISGYLQALRGFSIASITTGIAMFLRGQCGGVNPKYVPTPPELAKIVRSAVVPSAPRYERARRPEPEELPGAKARMRLKMPMYNFAFANGRMDDLAAANRDGFAAMIVLAQKWGITIPPELLELSEEEAERQWRYARNNAWAEIERDPPPFLRNRKFSQAAE